MITSVVLLFLALQIDADVYLNSNYVNGMAHEGNSIWWATTGGAVRLLPLGEEYEKYSNGEGFLNNYVVDVAVDSEGNKYFLHRTEGVTILSAEGDVSTRLAHELGTPGDTLTAILVVEDKLLIGTNEGYSFDGIPYFNGGLVDGRINRVRFFGDTLWFCTQGGISKVRLSEIEGGPWTSYDSLDGLPSNSVSDLTVTSQSVWAATDRGVSRFNGATWVPADDTTLPSPKAQCIVAVDTVVWVGTDDGVATWQDGRWVVVSGGLTNRDVRGLSFDSSGKLWASTWGGGIADHGDSEWTHRVSPGPASNFINDVFLGDGGEIWCTHFEPFNPETRVPSLSRFHEGEWTILGRDDFGDVSNFVTGAADGRGSRWVTAFGYGILEYTSSDSFVLYTEENSGLRYNYASAVTIGDNDDRFFSFYASLPYGEGGGVSVLLADGSEWATFSRTDGYTQDICELALDSTGILWLGSCRAGYVTSLDFAGTLTYPDDDRWEKYTAEYLASAGEIHALAVDRQNRVWIGTADGIRVVTDGEVTESYDESNSALFSDQISDIEFDPWGGTWIGTDNGLNHVWSSGGWDNTRYTLPDEDVKAIAVDRREKAVWVGTSMGLCKIVPDWEQEDPEQILDAITVYPNPLLPAHSRMVHFRDVPLGVRIRIYTLSGTLVAELTSTSWDVTPWDATDSSGARVASGVYIYHLDYGGVTKTGKFAIVN